MRTRHGCLCFTRSDEERPAQPVQFAADEGNAAEQQQASGQSGEQPDYDQDGPEPSEHWEQKHKDFKNELPLLKIHSVCLALDYQTDSRFGFNL